MAIIYHVTIQPSEKENNFKITWGQRETQISTAFDSPADLTTQELKELWQQRTNQLLIGQKLFGFLDGPEHFLQHLLEHVFRQAESLLIYLRTCPETADWPFELLAVENSFLLHKRVHLVRYVSDWGIEKTIPPQDEQLKLLFMASSAINVQPELDYEKEEEAIFKIAETLPIDIDVEDSGSLTGLHHKLVQERFDVVHLAGHADIDQNGSPFFIMEDETGKAHHVSPDELWNDALIENTPRLLFLSGCRTGETPNLPDAPENMAAVSFARLLVEQDIPAVLGWGRSVGDEQAGYASKIFLQELSRGRPILDAVQRVRLELQKEFPAVTHPAWPLLRLYSSGIALNAIVKENQRKRPNPQRMKQVFLKNNRINVLKEGFVGRRRQLQCCIFNLNDHYKVGLLLLGTAGLGKSALAGKLCERYSNFTSIIINGKFDRFTLVDALEEAFVKSQDDEGQKILASNKSMADKLANLCATSFKEKNYILLLDGFDQNLEGATEGKPGPLMPEAAELLKSLLRYLSCCGKMTHLIVASRYDFTLTRNDRDLVADQLAKVWLTSFLDTSLRKKAQELQNINTYDDRTMVPYLKTSGLGNPLLMERLDQMIAGKSKVDSATCIKMVKEKQAEFLREYKIRPLLEQMSRELNLFIGWISVYRRPVQKNGIGLVAEKAALKNWQDLLKTGMGLSLIEHDQSNDSYRVTPLVQKECFASSENQLEAHKIAFTYYHQKCADLDPLDPLLTQEWIYHAAQCGEEDVASLQGGNLVKYYYSRVELQESKRVGQWVLSEKKRDLSTAHDMFLQNSLAATINRIHSQSCE